MHWAFADISQEYWWNLVDTLWHKLPLWMLPSYLVKNNGTVCQSIWSRQTRCSSSSLIRLGKWHEKPVPSFKAHCSSHCDHSKGPGISVRWLWFFLLGRHHTSLFHLCVASDTALLMLAVRSLMSLLEPRGFLWIRVSKAPSTTWRGWDRKVSSTPWTWRSTRARLEP